MNKETIEEKLTEFINENAGNYITKENALAEDLAGMRIYEAPLVGIGSAEDELFTSFKKKGVVGEVFMTPQEWLPGARSVISYFLPFTEDIRKSNGKDMSWPSLEWLHGRIEGQSFMVKVSTYLKEMLEQAGYKALVPVSDSRFSFRRHDRADFRPERYRLYQQLVGKACGLCVRPGDVRTVKGADYQKRHSRQVWQRDYRFILACRQKRI
jgi:hypothetical protein